ncbi:UNVERIFIED_CONTAM: SNF1-related protein kinase regulatory subunit beta-2 [Sesamum latifolium]|uniref:SNF1-related protein kinase regulatory subunit beta-2 n=1 Tax=Sesamum latifolium TaxID=2727402 RepID=A0AAW2UZA6_9LAMI
MGIFPLDYNISASKLIKLWCAEEFLESNMTEMLEYVAMDSLDQLVRANVVMVCEQSSVNQGIENQRRLCIHNNGLFGIKDVRQLMASVANMRSLLCSGPHHPYPVPICLGCFSFLRVLDALTIRFYGFPIEVIKLVKLRYLAFTYNGELPASISKLQNLQYLIVHQYLSIISSGAHRWYLPMEIWNMQELRHLEVMGSDLPEPSYDTDYLWNLLTLYGISTCSCTKEVLERIPMLMKLGIQIRLAVDDVVVEPLCCFGCLADLTLVQTLKCCIVNPKGRVHAVISAAPRVPIFPSNITKLTLSGFGFPWEQMSTIAHLPELEVLKLRCNAFQGQDWTTYEGEFPQLRFLLLEDIDLRYWTAHHPHTFPLLSRLFIRHCYKLERIPPKYGDKEHLRIDLIDCNPGLVAFAKEEILKKDELENESRLIVINIESSADGRRQFMSNYEAKLNSVWAMTGIKMGNANGREEGGGSDSACGVDETVAPQVSMTDQDVVQGFPISFDVQTSDTIDPLQRPDELHIPSPSWMQTSSGYEDMYDEQGVPTMITWS